MRRVLPVVVAAVLLALAVWPPARAAEQALLLLPALFPSAAVDPLPLLTPPPVREQRLYRYAGGDVQADLFRPSAAGRAQRLAGMILLLGAGDVPRSDLAVHFADALARLGIVVLIPQTSGLLGEHLSFAEVDAIRQSVAIVSEVAGVDPSRIGVLGLSASGGLALVAAGQPDLRARIRFVNSFGSYSDARHLLVDVASRSVVIDGAERAWQPEPRTLAVVSNALDDAGFPAEVRQELRAGTTRRRAQELVAAADARTAATLRQISPASYLRQITARLYLMHDVDDSFIPYTESRDLVAQAPAGLVSRYTEFSIFAHVIPERPVPWQTFAPDVWRLFWHTQAVLLEML